jgi:hypothetical protein
MREINNQVAEGLNAKTLINTVQCYPTAWLDNIQTNKKGPLGFSVGRPYMGGSLVRQNSDILQYPGRDVGTRL